ncbi:MAG: Uma2 family endonuclease [Trichocoleus desertorum ATA4-8-CV12]|nr:Uma2 family endonuclease [Trichocoleus desertorum ATA4-8-CV12]
MSTLAQPMTLEAFLQLPETQPASEFIDGAVIQKPMPQGEHSRIQSKFCAEVNQVTESQKIAYAFPELRCVFGGDAIVPDVAVFRWERIPRTTSGRIANRFELHPDWAIEILSPEQSQTKVLGKLLHCSQHGTELGWLIDPEDESILVILPQQRVQILQGESQLPILSGIGLELKVNQIFDWLTL